MARGVNKVILIGNCGQDPDVRQIPNGGAVTNVSVATSETWRDKQSGEQRERTEWHRVVFFNRLAEIVGEYVKKGSKIYIEGQLRTRKWQKEGVDVYTTEIVASEMQMLDSRGGQQGGGQQSSGNDSYGGYQNNSPSPAVNQPMAGNVPSNEVPFDDDIPF